MLHRDALALTALPIFTVELLAAKIFQAAFSNLRIVDEPVLTLLFHQAIVTSDEKLTYFTRLQRGSRLPQGTFERIVHVIRKLKEVGVYADALAEETALDDADEQPKLRDIATIYDAYERVLASLDGVDAEGAIKSLYLDCSQARFSETFRMLFPAVKRISIVGFDEFTEPEIGFLQKLRDVGLPVSLVFDFQHGNPSLFGHLEENYRRFVELGFVEGSRTEADGGAALEHPVAVKAAVRQIADALFHRNKKVVKTDCSSLVTVAKAKDRRSEVEMICKLIKQLIAEHPTMDVSKICVAFYKPQLYTPIVREQFAKFGIPVNVTDRFELAQSPLVAAIIGLLQMAARNFHRDDVLRALSSSYFDFRSSGKMIDRANLAIVSLELRILAEAQSWQKKIERQIAKIEREKSEVQEEEEPVRRTRDGDRLRRAKADIEHLVSLLSDLARELTPSEFQRELQRLLDSLDVSRKIMVSANGELVEKDARAFAKFLDVVEQMVMLLEYQDGTSKSHPLQLYVEQLRLALSQERYNVREQFGAGVLVTSIDETRGLPMDVMIVGGLVDGEFPSSYQSELFFSAKRLKERERRHVWENRYLFYQAVTNWSTHLYLTYPEQDADLDLVRSNFVDALKSILDVEEWSYPSASPFDETICSQEEFLREQGRLARLGVRSAYAVPLSLKSKVKHIERAIQVEQSRVETNELDEYSGVIFDAVSDEARAQLEQLRHRVYSVSQLERYGKCPFQFFSNRLLRLNALDDFEEEFSALEKGLVLHDILFEFYTERREKNLPRLINCSEKDFSVAYQRLLAIAERRLNEIDIPDAFWDLEKELIMGDKDSGRGVLYEFLDFERNRSTTFTPAFFEVGFGAMLGAQTRLDESLSREDPIVAGAVQLRGKVDRIEIGEDAFSILDYKSGKQLPSLEDMRRGISLQLPIYLYTMEKLLAEKLERELNPAGALYYQIRDPAALKPGIGSERYKRDLDVKSKLLGSDQDLRTLIDDSIARINTYVDEIAAGRFPLTSHDNVDKICKYCDYKTICRIQTVRRVEKGKDD
jgi:ATP-dependent helicase/nuclease subunit B